MFFPSVKIDVAVRACRRRERPPQTSGPAEEESVGGKSQAGTGSERSSSVSPSAVVPIFISFAETVFYPKEEVFLLFPRSLVLPAPFPLRRRPSTRRRAASAASRARTAASVATAGTVRRVCPVSRRPPSCPRCLESPSDPSPAACGASARPPPAAAAGPPARTPRPPDWRAPTADPLRWPARLAATAAASRPEGGGRRRLRRRPSSMSSTTPVSLGPRSQPQNDRLWA